VGALLGVALLACATARTVRTPVYDHDGVRVFLREDRAGGQPVPRDFSHPAVIAPIRIARILASLDVRERDGDKRERRAAIETELVHPIGDGVAEALERATPDQEVVVMAISRKRRLHLFTAEYLTSMVVWVQGDELWIHLGALDTQVSSDPTDKPREPRPDQVTRKFSVLPGNGVRVAAGQTVAASWRDEVFSRSGPIRTRPGGRVLRRTILMDSEVEAAPEPDKPETEEDTDTR